MVKFKSSSTNYKDYNYLDLEEEFIFEKTKLDEELKKTLIPFINKLHDQNIFFTLKKNKKKLKRIEKKIKEDKYNNIYEVLENIIKILKKENIPNFYDFLEKEFFKEKNNLGFRTININKINEEFDIPLKCQIWYFERNIQYLQKDSQKRELYFFLQKNFPNIFYQEKKEGNDEDMPSMEFDYCKLNLKQIKSVNKFIIDLIK